MSLHRSRRLVAFAELKATAENMITVILFCAASVRVCVCGVCVCVMYLCACVVVTDLRNSGPPISTRSRRRMQIDDTRVRRRCLAHPPILLYLLVATVIDINPTWSRAIRLLNDSRKSPKQNSKTFRRNDRTGHVHDRNNLSHRYSSLTGMPLGSCYQHIDNNSVLYMYVCMYVCMYV